MYRWGLLDRNRAWGPRIDEAIATKTPTLIAVGTLHVVGQDSVQALSGREFRPI